MSRLPRPKVVSFDLDETLLDNSTIREVVRLTCEAAASLAGLELDAVTAANAEVFPAYFREAEAKLASGSLTGAQMLTDVWSAVLELCGCQRMELVTEIVAEQTRLGAASARLFADVMPTLEVLRREGYLMALVTNGASDIQRESLDRVGLADGFDFVAISGEVGAVKPEARIFEAVLGGLGVDAAEVWHVGDSLHTDIGGALNSDLTAVWINRRGLTRTEADPQPAAEINSIDELIPLLRLSGT